VESAGEGRHVIVKFSEAQEGPQSMRSRDLLLAEHLALSTLGDAGIAAAKTSIYDHQAQRFLEVQRFDRVGALGRQALISLRALDAEFVGAANQPWPVIAQSLAKQGVRGSRTRDRFMNKSPFRKNAAPILNHLAEIHISLEAGRLIREQIAW